MLIIAQKYGFKPSMWSDLFWHLADKRDLDRYIPEDVTLCHWDSWTDNENRCTENLKKHKRLTNNVLCRNKKTMDEAKQAVWI